MSPEPALDISVLIATRSRAQLLRGTLESMCALDTHDLMWELLVVDNGSTDDTPAVLDAYRRRLPLVTLHQPEPGKNRSLNAMLGRLRGALTVLTDDDVILPPDWLQVWKAAADRWPGDAVFGGRIVPRFPPGTPDWIVSRSFPMRAQCFAAFEPRQGEAPYDGTAFGPNLAVRTPVFTEHRFADNLGPAGGRYAMGGETEFLWRLRDAGYRIIYVPDACVEHVIESDRLTQAALFSRARNAGRGDELRRMMGRRMFSASLWIRRYLVTAPKIAAYFLVYHAMVALPARLRFRRGYKLHTAYGRWQQLGTMIRDRQVVHPSR